MSINVRLSLTGALVTVMVGCSSTPSETDSGVDAGGFQQPAGTIAVNFTVDDNANKTYVSTDGGPTGLEWKGGMKYAAATRKITKDPNWEGPWAPLYDDGPWTSGGHEPEGAVAGDHKVGITVFATPPATGTDTYEYGLIDGPTGGWLWRGTNGNFDVASAATSAVTAAGINLLPFGTTDLKLIIDTSALAARPPLADGGVVTWDTSAVAVKGQGWGWVNSTTYDDGTHGDETSGDGKYTFVLSNYVGTGQLAHYGLLSTGDSAEFVYVLGADKVEYKDSNGMSSVGVTAFLKPSGGSFSAAAITKAGNGNPTVVVP